MMHRGILLALLASISGCSRHPSQRVADRDAEVVRIRYLVAHINEHPSLHFELTPSVLELESIG